MKTETVFFITGEIIIHRDEQGKAIAYQPVSYIKGVRVIGAIIYK